MDEEDFPRRTRSTATAVKSASEKKGLKKKTKEKKDEDRVLFQEEKPSRESKRKIRETQTKKDGDGQKTKQQKTKKTSEQKKKKPADDNQDDDDDDDLGLKFLGGSDDDDYDDDDDDEAPKPKKRMKEKLRKKDKKKGKEAKKTKLDQKGDGEESEASSDEEEGKTKKKKGKPLKGSLDEDVEAFDGGVRRRPFVNLTQKTITADMFLLAVVKEVRDYEIVLSLPGGSSGFLPITSISDIYTRHLEKLSKGEEDADDDDDDDDDEVIPRPKDIFTIGSLLACKVKSVEATATGRPRIQVSVKPSEVNANLAPSVLREGMVLNGCVSSKEDHGYMVDMGIRKVQAFLGWKEARRFITERNMGKPFYIGQPIQCLVTKVQGNGRSLVLNADPSEVSEAIASKESHNSLQSLLPGTKVTATIAKLNKDHLVVTVLDNYPGHIAQLHVEDNSFPTDHYKPQQQVTGTIICNNRVLKTVAVSLNPYHQTNHFEVNVYSPFAQLRQGTTVEQARLLRVDAKTGLLVKINNKLRGVVHPSQLPEKEAKKLKEAYRSGQKVDCRIIDFNWFDAVALLSMKKSTMEQPFLGYHDIKPGVTVEGSVYSFSDKGVKVQVADRTFGFVPNSHMADIPISKPKDKYKVGDKLKLRVLTVDPIHRRLVLTHKKTLVESTLPAITAYDQAEMDMMLHGFIVAVKDFGCIVSFYNDVKGLIPTKELSSDPTLIPSQAFRFGQVVKCRIIYTHHPSLQKITLSLRKTGTSTPAKKPVIAKIPLGQVESVQVTNVAPDGLEVTLTSEETSKGFIPIMHLSDHHDNCRALLASYKDGDMIEEAMYWSFSGQKACPIFTCKRSILKTADDKMASDLKNLETGMMLMGHVKRIMEYGVFVEANSSLVGLAPKAALSDDFITNTDSCFQIGQTVRAHVTQVDKEKGRFLVSLRSSQCPPESDEGMHLLEDYLSEREVLCKRLEKGEYKHIVKLTPGMSVVATVTEIQDGRQLICSLPHDIRGIVSELPEDAEFEDGDKISACVLHSNIQENTVFLSVKSELVEFNKAKKKKTPKKKAGKNKGKKDVTVEFVHDHFVLGFVAGEGFVYLPGRRHLNEIQLGKDKHTVGQTLTVSFKSVVSGYQLAEVIREKRKKVDSDTPEKEAAVKLSKAEKLGQVPELQVGQMVTAIIKSVKDLQLYVTTDKGIYGRVHVTEVTDDMMPGSLPLESFKVGDTIQAKVIGHREIKEHKFLPITHRGFKRMGLELSLKKSVLDSTEVEESSVEDQLAGYKNGQNVMVVIHKYHKNILWVTLKPGITGKVYQLNLSKRPGILNDPSPYFKLGSVHQAQVLSVDEEQKVVELTMTGNTSLDITKGAVVNGRITNIQPDFGLHIQLAHGLHGTVHVTAIHDEYQDNALKGLTKNHCIRCYVMSCDNKDNIVLSMKASLLGHKSNVKTGRPLETISHVKKGQLVKGYVKKTSEKGVFLSLSRTLVGRVELRKISSQYFIGAEQLERAFPLGKMLSAMVISMDESSQKIELSCCHDDTGLPDQMPVQFQDRRRADTEMEESLKSRKRTSSTSDVEVDSKTKKRLKLQKKSKEEQMDKKRREIVGGAERRRGNKYDGGLRGTQDSDSGVEEALSDTEVEIISKESSDKSEAPRLAVSAGFSWDDSAIRTKTTKQSVMKRNDEEDESASSSSSSSEDESDKEQEEKKPVKKSKKEVEAEKKAEEDFLYKTEHALMDNERTPETTDDFDRLVLSSPDSSLVWIRYMAYHLHSAEIEKARAVAERGLKAISFREEQEKLNVWVAYMNLENMYGTEESLMDVFERALKFNEPIKVFQQLVNIYVRTEKMESAERLYGTMVKRFNFNKEVWINFGMFLMKHSKQETARKLMQRSFKSLQEREHVDVIVKFSQMEFKFGEVERGKTMFENILSNYPKRTDIWSVYLDMMIKSGDVEATRHVFERVIHLTLSAKKMKFFFKRYLDFEKKFGTESTVDSVKQKAVEYVESKTAFGSTEES